MRFDACLSITLLILSAEPIRSAPVTSAPCDTNCRTCVSNANSNQGVSDDSCAQCGGSNPYPWWPCNQPGVCQCVEQFDAVEVEVCSASTCDNGPTECLCARNSPPGGLDATEMPQFIVMTVDDAVGVTSEGPIRQVTSSHTNANGCTIPATWFVSVEHTNADVVRGLFLDGHEIATHSFSHAKLPDVKEIGDAREWLAANADIPKRAINGFRAPFLAHNTRMRDDLHELGFRYDSSIGEQFSHNSKTSPSSSERLFPYTMDYGIPQECKTGTCGGSEQHEGLWEVPMWTLQGAAGNPIAAMDPPTHAESSFDIYRREFDRNYHSNRAPVGMFFHSSWFIANENRTAGVNQFFEYALSHENVWVVTVNQLLDYLADPVPAADFAARFTREVQCPQGGYLPREWGLGVEPTPKTQNSAGSVDTLHPAPETTSSWVEQDDTTTATSTATTATGESMPSERQAAETTTPSPTTTESNSNVDYTVPCSAKCRTCLTNPESNILSSSHDLCSQCGGPDPYPWWPCNLVGPCYCSEFFEPFGAEATLSLSFEAPSQPLPSQHSAATHLEQPAEPSHVSIALAVGFGFSTGILCTLVGLWACFQRLRRPDDAINNAASSILLTDDKVVIESKLLLASKAPAATPAKPTPVEALV